MQNATRKKFYEDYPLHPELMDTLTEKTATIGNFYVCAACCAFWSVCGTN